MNRLEYMIIPVKHIPENIMSQYTLYTLVFNSYTLVDIRKGHVRFTQKRLNAHLLRFGFKKYEYRPGLYARTTRETTFTLVDDDFGIK